MIDKIEKRTVKDLYTAAAQMMAAEMKGLKKKDLTPQEQEKVDILARVMAKGVLKEMNIV